MIQAVFNSDLGRLEAYSNGTLVAWKNKYSSVIHWTISGCSFNINWEILDTDTGKDKTNPPSKDSPKPVNCDNNSTEPTNLPPAHIKTIKLSGRGERFFDSVRGRFVKKSEVYKK